MYWVKFMKVLVTGGAGFIGSYTVDVLVSVGHAVSVLDNLSTGNIYNLRRGVCFYYGSLCNPEFVHTCIEREQPEAIIHLAAQVSVKKSIVSPAEDAQVNIVGTVNLLEAARCSGVKKIIYSSSAAIYGNPDYLPVDEKHPVKPLSGYGLSKYSAERYLALYRELYDIEFTVYRYSNVYGYGQDSRGEGGVVAVFMDRMNRGLQPVINGDGEQTRDFVHVSDVAAANLLALDKGGGMVLNIGTGRPVSINNLFNIIKNHTGYTGEAIYGPPRPGDIKDSWFDSSRAYSILGWKAEKELDQGIKETISIVNTSDSSRI